MKRTPSSMASPRRSIFCGADPSDRAAQRTLDLFRREREDASGPDASLVESLNKLFHSIEENDVPEASRLLSADMRLLNAKHPDRDGNTALHVAAESDAVNVVRMLLELGSNSEVMNDYGLTALALADSASQSCAILSDVRPLQERREGLRGETGGFTGVDPFQGF